MKNLQDDYLLCLKDAERLEQEALEPILVRQGWEGAGWGGGVMWGGKGRAGVGGVWGGQGGGALVKK